MGLRVNIDFIRNHTSATLQLNFPVRKNVAGASCPSNLRLEATATKDSNPSCYLSQSTSNTDYPTNKKSLT